MRNPCLFISLSLRESRTVHALYAIVYKSRKWSRGVYGRLTHNLAENVTRVFLVFSLDRRASSQSQHICWSRLVPVYKTGIHIGPHCQMLLRSPCFPSCMVLVKEENGVEKYPDNLFDSSRSNFS